MDWFDAIDELKRPLVEQKEWMKNVDLRLATVADLDTIVQECIDAGIFGLDLETTGLDQRSFEGASNRRETVDKIVGYCIAASTSKGWYIPVRHREEGAVANVPPRLMVETINKIQAGGAVAVFHNAKFDQKFLDCEPAGKAGEWDDPSVWEDTFILAYLRNTRERRKSLKALAIKELDREMIELKELFSSEAVKAKKLDFSTLDPNWDPVVWYAAADAVNTLALYEILHPQAIDKDEHGNGQKVIYRIEKACLRATIWMEDNRIPINRKRLEGLIRLGQDEWWTCITDVYDEASVMLGRDVRPSWVKVMVKAGYDPNELTPNYMETRGEALIGSQDASLPSLAKSVPRLDDPRRQETVEFPAVYDVTIPAKVGILLRELGVKGLEATPKSGQVKTSQDVLDRVIEEAGDQFPFMAKIRRFREVTKGLGTFLFPIWWDTTPERSPDGCVWAGFQGHKVDTGRFSTPTPREKKKEFFHGQVRWGVHMTPATYDKSKPECVRRTREIVSARPGYILFAKDYSGVELRIVTNLSGEPKWLSEFFRCSTCEHTFERDRRPPPFCPKCGSDKIGDLHSLTAYGVFGDGIKGTGEFKQRRQQSKCVHPDTLVQTPQGLTALRGLVPYGKPDTFLPVRDTAVLGPCGEVIPVKESYNGGVKPLFHVVTRRGVLTCSDTHRFALADGSLLSLQEGLCKGAVLKEPETMLAVDRPYPTIVRLGRLYLPGAGHTAYFAGVYLGDGCASEASVGITHGNISKTDALGVPYKEWQDRLMESCTSVGLSPTARQEIVYLGARHTTRWMEALGLVQGNPPTKRTFRIPAWIFQAGREAILHFLAGLIDTDGSVSKHGDTYICTKDFVFAGQIAEAFRAVGCRASVQGSYNKPYDRWYAKVGVARRDTKVFASYMKQRGKVARISATTTSYTRWDNEVLEVLPAGDGQCVDLHLESEDHLYLTNGLTTHNSLNFAMCYGGGGGAATRAVGVGKEEGWRIKNQFDKTYRTLQKWWKKQHLAARKQGYVTTAFGRKYPLPDIKHENGGFRSKAERNSVNGPVQGTSADIIKLAMAQLYKEFKSRGWIADRRVLLTITIHDELVFEIREEGAGEVVEVIEHIMVNKCAAPLKWTIPLKIDIEFGDDWTVPFNLTEMAWNKGGGDWTERWVKAFPAQYTHYLSCGGAPLADYEATPPSDAPSVQEGEVGSEAPVPPERVTAPVEQDGSAYVYRVRDMTAVNAERLARVLHNCRGKGVDTLHVRDSEGNDLIGGPVKVAYEEFRVIADYERVR